MELAERRRREREKMLSDNKSNNFSNGIKCNRSGIDNNNKRNVWSHRWQKIGKTIFLDMFTLPFSAQSRTNDTSRTIDVGSFACPIRAFLWCTICPYLCYPIALCNAYGYLRCLCTMRLWPKSNAICYEPYVMYTAQKRIYKSREKKIEEIVIHDREEINYALQVTGEKRNQFINDPHTPGTAYYVAEQKVIVPDNVQEEQYLLYNQVTDVIRYIFPITIAIFFRSSCAAITTDLRLWWQGRIRFNQLRHPIANFWKDHQEYSKQQRRIVFTTALPKDFKPWSANL